ncbi:Rta1 domain-containing protein [Pleurostoma richardsiae]|uniref:Rta1 domain-containing protein n=1 Tax=Pleurostoma richardsiae TaxID=41990 RepID=A0AA38RVC4_9PEZI|nr:Rta1 domain-containing protein [Pleurostoma richardsiae]
MADDDVVWLYKPSLALAIVGTVLYSISWVWLSYLTIFKYRAWFFICVVVGALIEVVGYAIRCYSVQNQTQVGPFATTLSLIVLAPLFVAAGNYLLIGRLIRAVLPPSHHTVLRVPARLLTRLFVACDVVSFLVQCSGSGVASSSSWSGSAADAGVGILIAGLVIQVVTFCAYGVILARFRSLVARLAVPGAPEGWRWVLRAVYVSSALILLRSVYRVVEFAEGVHGYAFTHEWMFWVFEALPMIVAITVFCIWHPAKYLGRDGRRRHVDGQELEGGEQSSSDASRFK